MTEQELQILESMMNRIETCESDNRTLLDSVGKLVRSNLVLSESLDLLRTEYERYTDNAIYEIMDPRNNGTSLVFPKVRSIDETLDVLIDGQRSLCRFGDGEFACISGNLRAKFTTKYNEKLADRLREILTSNDDSIMVAIADNYGRLDKYAPSSRREIRHYMTPSIRREHEELLDKGRYYYNAYITRPYMFLYDSPAGTKRYWDRMRSLWDGKKVVIIEGSSTGMGVGNDLLDNCAQIRRIISPATDAFDMYDRIMFAALRESEDSLYLLALGPAATVLAYDIAKSGRRAIDIGHLDIEYEWMKRKEYRCAIPNKYVNETEGGTDPEPIRDTVYEAQIVCRV